jgi:hypothetical protein
VIKLRDPIFLLLVLVLLVVQSVFFARPTFRTDIASLIVVYLALERAVVNGAALALLVGYLDEVFAGASHGLYSGTMVLVFFAVRLLVARMLGEGLLFVTGISLLGSALALGTALGIERLLGPGATSIASLTPALPSLALSPLILGYPLYRLLRRFDARFAEPEEDFAQDRGRP